MTLTSTLQYLSSVHMDIVHGNTISKLGFRYGLFLLIDRGIKYLWFYGLKSLTSENIIECLEQFRAAGGLPNDKEFRADCDQKLLGGGTH